MKPNKKRTKLTLSEVETQMEVLTKEEMEILKGGGDGSYGSPYTKDEFYALLDSDSFNGGYVQGWGYVNALEEVAVYGSSNGSSNWNSFVNGIGAFTFANGVKAELIGYASTLDEVPSVASKYLKFSKGLGVVGGFIGMGSSAYNIYNDYNEGGSGNVSGWDVADFFVVGGTTAATIFLGSNPVGWAIAVAGGGYYIYRALSE